MRAMVFVIISLMLGGCMQETLAPVTQAGWSVRDKQLMSNLPYAQATIPEQYGRHIVPYAGRDAPGNRGQPSRRGATCLHRPIPRSWRDE